MRGSLVFSFPFFYFLKLIPLRRIFLDSSLPFATFPPKTGIGDFLCPLTYPVHFVTIRLAASTEIIYMLPFFLTRMKVDNVSFFKIFIYNKFEMLLSASHSGIWGMGSDTEADYQ